MKIIVAGGGTGGHVTPLLAIVETLKEKYQTAEIVFVGSRGGIEEKLIPQTGIKASYIRSGKFRRYHKNNVLNIIDPTTIVKNLFDFKKFILGIFDAMKILSEEEPDLIFLKGGYVSLPVGIAARLKGYPYFIHESDVVPGLANRILLKKAKKIFVSFPRESLSFFDKEKMIYSGNPIRKDILAGDKKRGIEHFGLKKDLKTVLIMGGSQGARVINELVGEKLEEYLKKYQLIHISGDLDYDWLEYKAKDLINKGRYHLASFLTSDLKDAYKTADIVISRAGNNALTELAAMKKPAIIIPLESSANDHQLANGKAFSRQGAVYLMLQSHLSPQKLYKQVDDLMSNPEELSFMSEKISSFYKEDASEIIAETLIEFYKGQEKSKQEKKDGGKKPKVQE